MHKWKKEVAFDFQVGSCKFDNLESTKRREKGFVYIAISYENNYSINSGVMGSHQRVKLK